MQLKATPAAASAPKKAGAAKGSWGKPGAKKEAPVEGASADRTILSNATAGFEMPVSTSMFESNRI